MGKRTGLLVLALAATTALAGETEAAGRPLAVSARIPAAGQADLLADGLAVRLRSGRARRVRVAATLAIGRERVPLGRARVARLAPGRWRGLTLALASPGRDKLTTCPSARILVRAVDTSTGRDRRVSRRLRLDPPDCATFFARSSVWNAPLSAGAPLDADSPAVTGRLVRSIEAAKQAGKPPWINTTRYSPPVYTAGPRQARVKVTLDADAPELSAAFEAVPIPAGAVPARGTDSELVAWQPSTDTLWEFWGLRRQNGRWHTRWGGRLRGVSSGPGHFAAPHPNWGATATGLPLAGGLITPRELRRGRIDHALAIAAPAIRANQYAWPAQRTDGATYDAHAVPEGAHFRLDPALDVDALGLAPPIAAIARAAQRYGIIVRDRSDTVAFYAQNPSSLRGDPYPAIFGGKSPAQLLRAFPWSRLQLTRMDLRRRPSDEPPPLHCLLGGCP